MWKQTPAYQSTVRTNALQLHVRTWITGPTLKLAELPRDRELHTQP